jgi:hypothetical protein
MCGRDENFDFAKCLGLAVEPVITEKLTTLALRVGGELALERESVFDFANVAFGFANLGDTVF